MGKFRNIFCILLVLFGASTALAETSVSPAATPTSFLDQILTQSKTDRSLRSIPEPWESGHLSAARMPILEDTLVNPFYVPLLTHVFGSRFRGYRTTVSPTILLENTFEMLNLNTSNFKSVEYGNMSLVDALEQLQTTHHRGVIPSDYRETLSVQTEAWPVELQEAITLLVQAFTQASLERQDAIKDLTRDEIDHMVSDISLWVSHNNVTNGNAFLTGVDENWATDLTHLRKVDYSRIFNAAKILTDAVELTRVRLQIASEKLPENTNDEILLEFHSAAGTILVGGPGINRYESDAALLVDLGGNDVYRNNAGGFIDPYDGVCCLIDMDGNDSYTCGKTGALAGAITTISLLIDYDGHDIYSSQALSQGAAFCGFGMLYDESGNDTWTATQFTQGAAAFGIGMAVDVGGDDAFICRSIGQGFGTTLGTGVLTNVNGNDSYSAGPAWNDMERRDVDVSVFCQGAGAGFRSLDSHHTSLYGGIGFLIDGRGEDRYIANNYSQAASRFGALGLLLDGQGNDGFTANHNCQGYAEAWSCACFINQSGNDWYVGFDNVQGVGVDHAGGFLLDYDGDDVYSLTGKHGQGLGRDTRALGLLVDYRGFDRYSGGPFSRGFSFGSTSDPTGACGVFLDHRGNDYYDQQPGLSSGNNLLWQSTYTSAGLDTPDSPQMYFANERAFSRHQHYDMSPVADLETNVDTSHLGSVDPFEAFHALGTVIDRQTEAIPIIVKAMQRGHDSYRRIMEEALGQILLGDPGYSNWTESILPLLNNLDPSTRQWVLIQLTRQRTTNHMDQIRHLLSDSDVKVRKAAIEAVIRFKDPAAEMYLKHICQNDISASNRAAAIEALGLLTGDNTIETYRDCLTDSDLAVHLTARKWIELYKDKDSIGTLQVLTSVDDPEIRVSAAKALVVLGEKSGFPILIETLIKQLPVQSPYSESKPLLQFLREYSGKQFDNTAESWQQWWIKSEATFNLPKIQEARISYLEFLSGITEFSPEKSLKKLKKLRKNYPEYKGLDQMLAPWIRGKAKVSLGKKHISISTQIARLAVEMDEKDPDNWAVLSETLFAQQKTDEALNAIVESLEISPKNNHYRKLRDIYRKSLSGKEQEK